MKERKKEKERKNEIKKACFPLFKPGLDIAPEGKKHMCC